MSPSALRLLAIGIAVAHAVASIVVLGWWWPRDSDVRQLVSPVLYLCFAGVYSLLTRRAPAGEPFRLRRGGFVSEATVRHNSSATLFAAAFATFIISWNWQHSHFALLLLWPLSLMTLLVRHPRVQFDRHTVRLDYYLQRKTLRWAALEPGAKQNKGKVRVPLRSGGWVELDVAGMAAEPAFLATAINRYIEDPWRRLRIGDPQELEELEELGGAARSL